jgi:hypothetical protein
MTLIEGQSAHLICPVEHLPRVVSLHCTCSSHPTLSPDRKCKEKLTDRKCKEKLTDRNNFLDAIIMPSL